MKQSNGKKDFVGECWPGDSVWIDVFNQDARQFWQSLYSFDNFKGTTDIYDFWVDMNEPSVFGGEMRTFPL